MRRLLLIVFVLPLLGASLAAAQVPRRGIVWEAPADTARAAEDLRRFRALGIDAVRTGLLDDRLLTLADTLGLALYQELPFEDLPASRLAMQRARARRLLDSTLARAARHPSARDFGLARRADTSDPRACAFFRELAQKVDSLAGARSYYVTAFTDADRCADTVDFVLLDTRDAAAPVAWLARWQAMHARPAGLAALGTWAGAGAGLKHAHSPEAQARYLETHLGTLLADSAAAPYALFVYRWRDVRQAAPSPTADLARPYEPGYGLLAADGTPRPALGVVEGFFTGAQTAFAFPAGEPPGRSVPWPVLYGWLVFAIVAACFALSPRFRFMVLRYFQAYSFYRDALREGRDVLLGASAALLVALALSVGVLGSVVLEVTRTTPAFEMIFRALPPAVQAMGVALLAKPWLLVLLLGSVYALSVALWTSLLSFASRRRQPLAPGQAMMLVVWRRWLFLPLLAGAMTVPALAPAVGQQIALILAGLLVVAAVYATVRTIIDYAVITYVPGALVALLALLNPLVLLGIVALALAGFSFDIGPALAFAWHLATRS